jgi:hypothetical protein
LLDRRLLNLHPDKKIPAKHLLRLLTLDELKQLYAALGKKESLEGASRGFIIAKIQSAIKTEDLLKNEYASRVLLEKISEAIAFIEGTVDHLERPDLVKVYEDVTSQKLKKEDLKKSEIMERLLNEAPINEIVKSKRFQERLKPKYISIADIKSLKEDIESLRAEASSVSNDIDLLSERILSVEKSLKEVNTKLRSMDEMFETGESPDLETFLKALYEESISIEEKLSPESFQGLVERLQKRLGINEKRFILKGIELLMTHYLLSEVKGLLWRPPFDEFMKILKEELSIFGEKADIPSLRNRVCRRLAIEDETFDELLTKAWREEYVKLEAGAPIGEFNVKYLVTKDGQKLYYARLR